MIVCSIDLMDGKAVQLEQGRRLVLERDDVVSLAERFGRVGEVAVIDLDAAMQRGSNRELIERLCRVATCRVGGGIRSADDALRYLRAGARSVILGTAATPEILRALPRERTMVALDARGSRVATHGWTTLASETPEERARRLAPYCGGFLFTDIEREGMMRGIDLQRTRSLASIVKLPLTVAGGVSSVADVRALDAMGVDAQVGMAIYTGALDPVEAFVAAIGFEKGGGLVPTIAVGADDGRVRMLGYSNPTSLKRALTSGCGVYWSRSRGTLWEKGESSGNLQRLRRVYVDCDRDALIFAVEQRGATCHSGTARCFPVADFTWSDLLARIDARGGSDDAASYTRRLLRDPELLDAKVREEADEVVTAESTTELAWECADLLYFMSVKMCAGGVGIDDVMSVLASRAV